MSNLSWVPRVNVTKTISATPTITASAYTSGLQLGSVMTLTDAVRQDTNTTVGNAILASITILDKAKQDAAIDVWLFKVSPTIASLDTLSFSMTDANLVLQCIGAVSLGTSYSDSLANSVSTNANLNIPVQVASSSATPTSVYAVAISRGTPTYTSTSDLQFQFTFYVD